LLFQKEYANIAVLHLCNTLKHMIKVENLTFGYNKNNPIINGLNLSICNGIHLLLGENGIGKTTLLHLLCGLCYPDKGTILYDDNADLRNPKNMINILFLPEEQRAENDSIVSFAKRHAIFYPTFNKELFHNNLKELNIDENYPMNKMSTGQRKKALLAYTLSLSTPFMLLDEPTSDLDITSKSTVQKMLIENISDDQTVIISTHSANDFQTLYDSLIFFLNKNDIFQNTIDDISQKILFVSETMPHKDALYYERGLNGCTSIIENKNDRENTINIEMLFRALANNENIRNILKNKRYEYR